MRVSYTYTILCIMDLWACLWKKLPLLRSSSVAPSDASISLSLSPISQREKALPNLTHMLHEIPHYHEVDFERLEVAEPFPPTVQFGSYRLVLILKTHIAYFTSLFPNN